MQQQIKICKTCNQQKPLSCFAKNKNCADKHLTECKDCNKIYRQQKAKHRVEVEKLRRRKKGIKPKKIFLTKEERKQAHLQSVIKWQQKNKQYIKVYQKNYYLKNKLKCLEKARQWRRKKSTSDKCAYSITKICYKKSNTKVG